MSANTTAGIFDPIGLFGTDPKTAKKKKKAKKKKIKAGERKVEEARRVAVEGSALGSGGGGSLLSGRPGSATAGTLLG